MNAPFLICGLPRSRTAWLSVFLNCPHELSSKTPSVDALVEKINRSEGNSDSIQVLFLGKIMKKVPNAKLVFIHRNLLESIRAFSSVSGIKAETCGELFGRIFGEMLEWKRRLPNSLWIEYEDLKNEQTAFKLWNYCRPHEEFDSERYSELEKLNIQQKPDLIKYAALRPHEFYTSILA